jgi:hypothetical protein
LGFGGHDHKSRYCLFFENETNKIKHFILRCSYRSVVLSGCFHVATAMGSYADMLLEFMIVNLMSRKLQHSSFIRPYVRRYDERFRRYGDLYHWWHGRFSSYILSAIQNSTHGHSHMRVYILSGGTSILSNCVATFMYRVCESFIILLLKKVLWGGNTLLFLAQNCVCYDMNFTSVLTNDHVHVHVTTTKMHRWNLFLLLL